MDKRAGIKLNPLTLKVKKLKEDAILPTRKTKDAACYDLYINHDIEIEPNQTATASCGIALEIPTGYKAHIHLRSGISLNGLILTNGVGVIDSDYRGEIILILTNTTPYKMVFEKNARLAQFSIEKVLEVSLVESDELSNTERNEGGLGSTGIYDDPDGTI